MKYKVGDKVRAKKNLKIGAMYGNQVVVEDMPKFAGKVVEIESVSPYGYGIKGNCYCWTDEMFEPTQTNHIAEVTKMLGVEIGEEFDINGFSCNPHRFTDSGLIDKEDDENRAALCSLIMGECHIVKRPFVPKKNDDYFYVDEDGNICADFNSFNAVDFTFIAFGNCFRTIEEAERNKETMLKKMNEYKR